MFAKDDKQKKKNLPAQTESLSIPLRVDCSSEHQFDST